MRHSRFRARPLLAALALTLLVAACGGSDNDTSTTTTPDTDATTEAPDATTSAPAADTDAFPVTFDHALGSTTIESAPTRVATVHWGNHDVPIALGVVPVGIHFNTYGDDNNDGVLPWTFAGLEALGATGDNLPALFDEVDGVNFEAVANVNPDVILASYSGISPEDWTTLEEIAPTVAYPVHAWGTNWRDMALLNGEAIGLRTEAEALIADIEAQIATALEQHPTMVGKTFAYAAVDFTDTSSISLYTPLDARVQLVNDLGMTNAPSVVELAGDTSDFFVSISSENIDLLNDVDVLITYGDDTTFDALQADPLLGQIPAIASGHVAVVPDGLPLASATSGPTVLSIQWILDEYLALIEAAAVGHQ